MPKPISKKLTPKLLSVDTESSGLDLYFGARPFLVTTCNEAGLNTFWEWQLNPHDRSVIAPKSELLEIRDLIYGADHLILHNAKFDAGMLIHLYADNELDFAWPWEKVLDTLLAAHLLASNAPHNLTDLALEWLGINIQPYEDALEKATKAARAIAEKKGWRIAKKGLPEMPSAKEKVWKFDSYLARCIAIEDGYEADHPWHDVCNIYANADSAVTLALFKVQKEELERRGLWKIYQERLKVLPVAYAMEERGITVSGSRVDELFEDYRERSGIAERVCINLAKGYNYDLKLPKSGNNKSLTTFIFDVLKLEVVNRTENGAPSLNKDTIEHYQTSLKPRSKPLAFINSLRSKRQMDTACAYMDGYKRFWKYIEVRHANDPTDNEESFSQVSGQGSEDGNMLDLDSGEIQERVRTISRGGSKQGPSCELPAIQGDHSRGPNSNAHLRQPKLCKPGSLSIGNKQRQLGRYGSQEQTSDGGQKRIETLPGKVAERGDALEPIQTRKIGQRGSERIENTPGENKTGSRAPAGNQPNVGSQGRSSSQGETNRRSGSGDSSNLCSGVTKPRETGSKIWIGQSVNDRSNYTQEDLETRSVGWYKLHPNLNCVGTATLRWSSSNPNEQNISKKENFNLRYCFGPTPDKEWVSIDYDNLELRLPAYESGEQVMIEIFEKPDEPPFFGSYHLMNASIIYPELFFPLAEQKGAFRETYKSTYGHVKNFGFAYSYSGGEETCDRAAHKKGAWRLVKDRLKEHTKLNQKYINLANKNGHVETMPDKEVDPDRGYPIQLNRGAWGRVSPTQALNYHIQSSACWVIMRAMDKVHRYLQTLDGYHIIAQIHDELVIEMPAKSNKGNFPIIQKIREIMESVGGCIGIPLTCGATWHPKNWSEGEVL